MSRVKFLQNKQGDFLNKVREKYKFKWPDASKICNVTRRTFFDWRRNKYQMSYAGLQKLSEKYHFPIPKGIKILPDTWYIKDAARLGGIRHKELYGSPGTPEGRKKGGMVSALKFRNNPGLAKKLGFVLRKQIAYPRKSAFLAEFIGIVLGDGTISEYQVRISTNSKTDKPYAYFVKRIISDLFKIGSTIVIRKKNTVDITISSRNLVVFLLDCSLKKGDKISQQVDVPKWIFRNRKFIKGCLRGLIDTDGGVYFHDHITRGIRYRHMGLCFTNHSRPLLDSVHRMLSMLCIKAKNDTKRHVSIYDRREINKYMKIVGSHNPKHIKRFNAYKNSRI